MVTKSDIDYIVESVIKDSPRKVKALDKLAALADKIADYFEFNKLEEKYPELKSIIQHCGGKGLLVLYSIQDYKNGYVEQPKFKHIDFRAYQKDIFFNTRKLLEYLVIYEKETKSKVALLMIKEVKALDKIIKSAK